MKTLAILGPLGSGKTTLVNKVLPLFSHLRILVIVNDVGTENIDARRIRSAGDVKALTAGCIGCSDLPAFKAIIEEAKAVESLDLLLIEPTGIADGREIRDAVVGSKCEFRAITLVDVRHFERNRALGCMESQLEVATTVALTWLNGQEVPEGILEFIWRHAKGREVLLLPPGEGELGQFLERLLETTPESGRGGGHICSHDCGYDHGHRHGRGDHGVFSFSLALKEDASYAELVSALAPHLSSLVRAKGVVNGRQFDYVQGDICLGEEDIATPHGNFIFNRKVEAKVFDGISLGRGEDTRSKKDRMREADVPLEATLAAITWQLGQYPSVVAPSGVLRVDCEADVIYQLAKRSEVPDDVRRAVMRKYVSWRLESALQLKLGNWEKHPQLSYWRRRLGINIGYMCAMYPDLVGDELAGQVTKVRPAEMLARGLLGLTELSFDEEKAEERPEAIAKAFSFGPADQNLLRRAIVHCRNLSEKNPAWHTRWNNIVL